jgi:hypothetical protein
MVNLVAQDVSAGPAISIATVMAAKLIAPTSAFYFIMETTSTETILAAPARLGFHRSSHLSCF